MAGTLDAVYLILALAAGILLVFGIWWTGRRLETESTTSDLLRAIAVAAFLLLMTVPLLN